MWSWPVLAHPTRLVWLLAVAGLLVVWLIARRRLEAERRSFGLPGGVGARRPALTFAALACLVVALAQPRWGPSEIAPPAPGHDVVLVVDVSRSMGAEDMVPDRLGAAVAGSLSLLDHLRDRPGHRAALVIFAGRASLRCPLTEDLDAVADALSSLRPGQVQPGGTDLGLALDAAADAFDDEQPDEGRAVVVFSDGEDHAGSWRPALGRLAALGVVVHAVALGDDAVGASVPLAIGTSLQHDGKTVISKRVDETMAALTRATQGAFLPLGTSAAADLGALYRDRIAPVARTRSLASRPPERAERFRVFLGFAAVLLVLEAWPARWPPTRPMSRTFLTGLVLALVAAAPASDTPTSWVAQGRTAFGRGEFAEALAAFERAEALAPTAPLPSFNVATTLYRLGRFDEAEDRYLQARERANPRLRPSVDYALGNTALMRGRPAEAIAHYDRCLAGEVARELRRDAEINRRFAIENLPRQAPDEGPDGSGERPPETGPTTTPDEPTPPESSPAPPSETTGPRPPTSAAPAAASPEERLRSAVERIRRGRGQEAQGPPPAVEPGRKDW